MPMLDSLKVHNECDSYGGGLGVLTLCGAYFAGKKGCCGIFLAICNIYVRICFSLCLVALAEATRQENHFNAQLHALQLSKLDLIGSVRFGI